jgi:transposase
MYENKKKEARRRYEEIMDMRLNEKRSIRSIASILSIAKSTVFRYISLWKNDIPVENIRLCSRPRKIKSTDHSFLGQAVAAQVLPTAKSLTAALRISKGIVVSPQTVRNHLKKLDYQCSIPRKIPLVTPLQERNRINWCLQHKDLDWKNVWFSDETYIEINHSTIPVWHKKGKKPTTSKTKFGVKIMCWGAVSCRFKSKLSIVESTMTADRYIEVLQGYLLEKNSEFLISRDIFQQDNASCHTARVTKDYLAKKNIAVLPWPASSPDLNPIENIWAILKQNVERRPVKSKSELIPVILEEWNKIDLNLIRKTIESMPRRLTQVIERGGKKCDY